MKTQTQILVALVTLLYIFIIRKIFPSKDKLIKAISNFSFMEFLTVFSGRVFEENIMEAFLGLALVVTVFFAGLTYALVTVVDKMF